MRTKKGSSMVWGFVIIFVSLLLAVFLGITVYTFNIVNNTLAQDVEIGQVNLKNVTGTTFGQINTGIINNADTIGIMLLLGMLMLMIFNGYYMGSNNPKLFIVVDIFILALFFIPSIYVSQIYNTFITSSTVFQTTFTDIIPKTSRFLLNLPTIIGITGIITMVLTYAGIKKDGSQGEGVNVLGY